MTTRHPGTSAARRLTTGLALVLGMLAPSAVGRAAAPYVWLEGESPTSANVPLDSPGSSHGQYLSGGKVLQLTADAGEVARKVPAEGALFTYAFTAPADADYQVWDRIGYEFARCPFDWRLDDGAWHTVAPDALTTDLMELDFFREIAWLKLGTQHLTAGKHVLTFRARRLTNVKGEPQRMLYACDAVCLSAGDFRPNSKFKPDESGRDQADRDAEQVAFDLPPAPADGQRTSVALKGTWEACRDDEQLPGPVAEPLRELPRDPVWRAIAVPGDKNEVRHDLLFAHRFWYRVRVRVPASLRGRSFTVEFPQNNLNTTVFVNGTFCGFSKNPFARFTVDITRAVKPGAVNELQVGIRDAWYGYYNDPKDPMKLRRRWNLPTRFLGMGFQDMVYPEWNHPQSGILETPVLTAAGGLAYAADVFVKPSVARKELAAEVTVQNPAAEDAVGEVVCEALDPKTRKVEKALPASPFRVRGGESRVVEVSGPWEDPRPWWPEEGAALYLLRTTVRVNGGPVDVSETPFGFREWSIDGKDFRLNGVVWHGWADVFTAPTRNEWLTGYRKTNQRFYRFWAPNRFFGMDDPDALDFFDREGIVVRRTGVLDGEGMGYEGAHAEELGRNWIDQECALIRGERNHPSVMLWSLENEISYINAINANWIDRWEKVTAEAWDRVHNGLDGRSVDPTRPVMVDGGGAGKAQALLVHGDHYITGPLTEYPALAYGANPTGGGRGRWTWDEKRPRFVGEDWFIAGNHPEFSTVGGEAAFGGKASALPAAGLLIGMAQQGYRWAGYGAWHFWMGQADADDSQYRYFAPRAALCRQWDWTFGSGQSVRRTIGLFNDTRADDPLTFAWSMTVAGNKVAGESKDHAVRPGTRETFDITLPMPAVESRAEAELLLTVSVRGHEVFRDVKPVSVLKPAGTGDATRAAQVLVADPHGSVGTFLRAHGVGFTPVTDPGKLPDSGKVLIVGRDALSPVESTSSALAAWAAAGRAVIVLEQQEPLRYQALPGEIESTPATGRVAFAEDLTHPLLHGLRQKDFFTWGDDEILFRKAYAKPASGGKSLVQCGESLQNSALVEVPAGKGLLLLCQLAVGEKLPDNAVAQQLLLNLLDYGAAYKQTFRPVTAVVEGAPQLAHALDVLGLQATRTSDPLEALRRPGGIAVVAATPDNLRKLAENLPAVESFTRGGGWLIFNGLTPDGLDSYNKIVGWQHLIRPFGGTPSLTNHGPRGVERVTFPPVRDPLLAGVTTTDITMYSSTQIFPWAAGNFTASDEFSYVVDYDEVAPFGKSSFAHYGNITNGFVSADGWPLIINFPIPKDDKPFAIPIELPKPQTITEFTWVGNTLYWPQTKVNLVFEGDREHLLSYDVKPNAEPQVLVVNPPRTAKHLTLEVAGWQEVPGKGPLVGIDNIYLKAQRPPEFHEKVKPMLNIGALLHYPRGDGGIVLCNLLFQEREEVAENAGKKQKILATILRNLKAPFAGGKAVIVGAGLTYTPLDLSKQATQYRDDKGWFGDRQFTFRDLPTGRQKLAGVTYDIYDFPTSPVPTVVMPAGNGVPGKLPREVTGIPVHRRADALFFLQTARIDQRMNERDWKEKKRYELCRYVIHYADGETTTVPVHSETDVDNYRQETPRPLPGAQIAWVRPYPGTKFSAVAYSMQWNNPHPEKEIATIDLVHGKDGSRGVPALLAVTAASAEGK
jgi:beta-galactosidase